MSDLPQRNSIRLPHFDYRTPAYYFFTVCTFKRGPLFGQFEGRSVAINKWGSIVEEEWRSSEYQRENLILDAFVVMPNHVHGIVLIDRPPAALDSRVRATFQSPLQPRGPATSSLAAFIVGFKGSVTRRLRMLAKRPELKVWQRNYFEHVIRCDAELQRIRTYIELNPANWLSDPENDDRTSPSHQYPWEKKQELQT